MAICYDRHYPEYMRALGVAGAELVVTPQAGATGEWTDGLYEAEMQIAAFQNGYFTALWVWKGIWISPESHLSVARMADYWHKQGEGQKIFCIVRWIWMK